MTPDQVKRALAALKEGVPVYQVAQRFGQNFRTLIRTLQKAAT